MKFRFAGRWKAEFDFILSGTPKILSEQRLCKRNKSSTSVCFVVKVREYFKTKQPRLRETLCMSSSRRRDRFYRRKYFEECRHIFSKQKHLIFSACFFLFFLRRSFFDGDENYRCRHEKCFNDKRNDKFGRRRVGGAHSHNGKSNH